MTCLVQWGLAAVVFLSLNRWLAGTARSAGAQDES
jgi:hypothetical protein